jgi:hypothetical protein
LKDKIIELESNSKNKNIRDLYEYKKSYQSTNKLAENEKNDLFANPHKIVYRWMNYVCELLNVQRVGDIRQQKYRQQSHLCQNLESLRLRLLLQS